MPTLSLLASRANIRTNLTTERVADSWINSKAAVKLEATLLAFMDGRSNAATLGSRVLTLATQGGGQPVASDDFFEPETLAEFEAQQRERAAEREKKTKWNGSAEPNGHAGEHADEPLPLFPPLPPAAPYPLDALGEVLAPAAAAIARKVQVPDAMAAQAVLA